ncbi:MAG: hypothetical protein LBU56_00900 [Rickettsiales bacterium]|jgi:DNA repair exonuclease SbcCD ATPase subunit|nr:hypothetical protein [Rickettsiales bacterium]
MENKFESKEENDPMSRLIKLLDGHFTGFTNKISSLFEKFLNEAKTSIDEKLLEPANEEIKEALNHLKEIREDIKKDLDWLRTELSGVLNNIKELTNKANSLDITSTFSELKSAIEIAKDKIERFELNRLFGWLIGRFRPTTQSGNDELLSMLDKLKVDLEKEKTERQEQLKEINDALEKLKSEQTQPSVPDSGAKNGNNTNKLLELEDKVKKLRDTVRKLELEAEQNKLQQKKEKLEQKNLS